MRKKTSARPSSARSSPPEKKARRRSRRARRLREEAAKAFRKMTAEEKRQAEDLAKKIEIEVNRARARKRAAVICAMVDRKFGDPTASWRDYLCRCQPLEKRGRPYFLGCNAPNRRNCTRYLEWRMERGLKAE